jgi:hypothetical protein
MVDFICEERGLFVVLRFEVELEGFAEAADEHVLFDDGLALALFFERLLVTVDLEVTLVMAERHFS